MTKIVLLLAVLVGSAALADAKFVSPTCSKDATQNAASACTQTAGATNKPTSATPGIDLANACAVRVTVSAASGQTLSGAGTIRFHLRTVSLGRYAENRVVTRSVTTSGSRDHLIDDLWVGVGYGKIYVEADSVTVSSGAVSVLVETVACKVK